ncbi:MAG: flagellar type III secretion system protein FlhB [Pseudomonadota bacterium]
MAETGGDAQEKSFDPTPRRLEQAREKGDLARSQDAQTFAAYLGLALALWLGGTWTATHLGEVLMAALAHPEPLAGELLSGGASDALPGLVGTAVLALAPVLVLPAGLVLALLIAQRAIVIAPDKAIPKLSRLSPIENASQKYGLNGLVEFAKSTVKLIAVSAVLAWVLAGEFEQLSSYVFLSPNLLGGLLSRQFEALIVGVLVIAGTIGLFDLLWQQASFVRRNRMSHQDLKDESKQAEGDPHLKAQRRERAQAAASTRLMADVPRASVVLTNPTHYAVALQWERQPGTAPVCLAKGVDHMAARIRQLAEDAGVPVHEDAPTARSIHALVDVGQEVRPEHYRAVAAAILFAEKMRERARDGAGP